MLYNPKNLQPFIASQAAFVLSINEEQLLLHLSVVVSI